MKKQIILLLISFFLTACGPVAADDYEKMISSKNLLIDVRTPMEYQSDHLEKAVNIPLDKIIEEIKYFAPDKEQAIIVYCSSGKRSGIAVKELKKMGYKNVINAGKFKELKKMEEKRNRSGLNQ